MKTYRRAASRDIRGLIDEKLKDLKENPGR
jgi:hypothetical protein